MAKKKAANAAPKKEKGKSGKKPLWETLKMDTKLDSVEGWARQGKTVKELADIIGVGERTIYAWKSKYPQFEQAIRAGARESNGELLKSAFDQARGYTRVVTEVVKLKEEYVDPASGKKLTRERAEVVTFEKYFEPDGRITRFMLTNRLSADYREKQLDEAQAEKEIKINIIAPQGCDAEAGDYAG